MRVICKRERVSVCACVRTYVFDFVFVITTQLILVFNKMATINSPDKKDRHTKMDEMFREMTRALVEHSPNREEYTMFLDALTEKEMEAYKEFYKTKRLDDKELVFFRDGMSYFQRAAIFTTMPVFNTDIFMEFARLKGNEDLYSRTCDLFIGRSFKWKHAADQDYVFVDT